LIKGKISDEKAFTILFPELAELDEYTMQLLDQYEESNKESESWLSKLSARFEESRALKLNLEKMTSRYKEHHDIFEGISDDLLTSLFPNKVNDVVAPLLGEARGIEKAIQNDFIQSSLYGVIRESITSFIQDSYNPLENDLHRLDEWKKTLESRIGKDVNVNALTDAPANFLTIYTKNFIQADPDAVGLGEWALNDLAVGEGGSKEKSDQKYKEQNLSALSKEQLASWVVESIQAMLHTEDPNLLNAGSFINGIVKQLTFGLIAKGAGLVVPEKGKNGEEKKFDENLFLKELIDQVVKKVKSLEGDEQIPDEFWKEFAKDLPIPPFLKDLIVRKLIEKANSLQETLASAKASED